MSNGVDQYGGLAGDPYNQGPIGSGYIPTGQPLIGQEGLTKWLQNPKEIIKEVIHKLQGLQYDKATKSYLQVRPPLLEEEGIRIIAASLDFHINRVITLSDFEEEMVNMMSYEIIIAIANSLQQNWVKAGIFRDPLPKISKMPGVKIVYLPVNLIAFVKGTKVISILEPRFDSSLYKIIIDNVDHIIFANISRAKGGKERRFLTMITQESIQKIEREGGAGQSDGMMSKIMGGISLNPFKK